MSLLEPSAKPVKKRVCGADALKSSPAQSELLLLYNLTFDNFSVRALLLVGLTEMQVGFVFFGWGILLAIASVFVAPRLEQNEHVNDIVDWVGLFPRFLVVIGINADQPVLVALAIIAGFFRFYALTTVAMENKTIERNVARLPTVSFGLPVGPLLLSLENC